MIIANDLFLGAFDEINVDYKQANVLGGNIFDLANCKKKEVAELTFEFQMAKESYGSYFIAGDHEPDNLDNHLGINNTAIFNYNVMMQYFSHIGARNGLSYLSHKMSKWLIKRAITIDGSKLSLISSFAHHFHYDKVLVTGMCPKETNYCAMNDVEIIILKRGVNVVDL